MLGLVTDAPECSAADVIRTYDTRWPLAPWGKEVKRLLGRGQYQQRSYRAAVIPLPLMCFAYALLIHLRREPTGAQGPRTPDQAADLSTAAAQDQLRRRLWEDLITSAKAGSHDQPLIDELERLRVA